MFNYTQTTTFLSFDEVQKQHSHLMIYFVGHRPALMDTVMARNNTYKYSEPHLYTI